MDGLRFNYKSFVSPLKIQWNQLRFPYDEVHEYKCLKLSSLKIRLNALALSLKHQKSIWSYAALKMK